VARRRLCKRAGVRHACSGRHGRRLRAPSEPMGIGGIYGRGHPTRSHQRRAAVRQRSWNQQCATQGLAAARAAMPRHCNRPCTAGMKLTGGLFAEASAGPIPLRRKTPGPCISSALPCCWPHRAFRPPNRAAYPAHPSTRAESRPHDRPLPHAVTRSAGRSLTPPHLLTHIPAATSPPTGPSLARRDTGPHRTGACQPPP
jgi:hypothetical protein